jgi:hypothetical protein
VTKPLLLKPLGLPFSEKQTPQVVENIENGWNSKEALEQAVMRLKQALEPAELRARKDALLNLNHFSIRRTPRRAKRLLKMTPTVAIPRSKPPSVEPFRVKNLGGFHCPGDR